MTGPTGSIDGPMGQIEHVVVLMLENRSLDSLLGWLYEKDRPVHNIPALKPGERAYEGLQDLDLDKYTNRSYMDAESIELRYNIDFSTRGLLLAGNFVWRQVGGQPHAGAGRREATGRLDRTARRPQRGKARTGLLRRETGGRTDRYGGRSRLLAGTR
jgi:hypothetical protein